jgi:hypothetical protein
MDIKYKIVSIDEETNSILIKSAPADSVVNIDEYPAIGYSLSAIDFSQNIEQQIISLVEPNTIELSVKQQQKDNALDVLKQMINQENSGVTVPPAPIEQLLVTDDMLQRFMDTYDRAKSGVEE